MLAKVRYEEIGHITGDRKLLGLSLLLNWIIGPALMFFLAWTFLPDQPEFRTGLIVVGLARCIAMVPIWNDLACGDREAAALLVAINSLFQIVAYAALGVFYLQILPSWLGWQTADAQFSTWSITKSVLIFLASHWSLDTSRAVSGSPAKATPGTPKHSCPHFTGRSLRAAVHDRCDVCAAGRTYHI